MGIAITSLQGWPICTPKVAESHLDAPSGPNNVGGRMKRKLLRATVCGEDAHGR